MRKSFTRLFSVVMLFCMISLGSIAQARWHNYQLEPDDGTCTVAKTGTFTITFDQDVIPVKGGKISLNAADGTQIYPIQFNWTGTAPTLPMVYTSSIAPYGTVTFDGKKVIVDFKATLKELTNYYISVSPGAIKDASGTLFGGILGTAPASGALTCSNDVNYGWDFTVGDFTAPTVAELTPKDEAKDVAGDQVLSIKFNESMVFAPGKSFASLADGDIALYTSTDPILGQYGGDVIYTKPASVTGTGTNTISIKWPGNMPSLTNVYVRVKGGIFAEYQECPSGLKQVAPKVWGGFNSNGQDPMLGDNGAWNFTTKDTRASEVAIARDNCNNNSNFTISIDEASIVTAGSMVALTNANVKQFVTFTGGDFDATISGSTVIIVNPKNDLASTATVTVGLKTGLWDASHNAVPATEKAFTNGDYLAPVITASAVNPVGTSFDLLAQANETSTVYYVVVKKSDVQKDGADFYKPTAKQVFDLANTYDGQGNGHIPTLGLYDDEIAGNQLATYFFDHATNTNDKTVNIWAAGKFDINAANTNVLERVLDLPRTNGTDYVVYAYAIDDSECGIYNHTLADNGWLTSELRYAVKTSDVLPAIPVFTADVNTKQFCETNVNRILRNGALKITFNEPIRLADGTAITPASLETIFYVENAGKQIGINTVTSSIDASKKVITLYPDSAFKSGSTVYIKLLSNKIEDEAGVERNVTADKNFCVENYCEPLIKWTADVVRPEVKDNAPIANGAVEVAKDATIQVVLDQLVYAPADNEYPKGTLTQLSNNSSDIFWAGRFIKVREAASLAGAPTGTLIYANGNEDNFDVTVNAYSEGKTVITITPKGGYTFGSEMFYNVEIEGQLQNAERYTLLSHICNGAQTNNVTFQVTDHLAPVVSFFEANGVAKVQDLNKCVNCDTPSLDVKYDNRIGVKISEWVELGFDGFRDLEGTETIKDANALRRYFSLTECNGTAIKFDVKDFSLDKDADVATMYIDPYDYPSTGAETPNFKKGEGYTVKFISNPNELPETGTYYPGAFEDDHGNLVNEGQSCFKVYKEPVPVACFDKVIVGTDGCNGVKADLATLSIKLQFKQPMFALATAPLSYMSVWAKSAGNDHLVGYIPTNKMVTTDGGLTYVAKPTSISWIHENDAYLVDQTEYYIAFNSGAATTANFACFSSVDQTSGNACSWPTAADYKLVTWLGGERAVVDTFKTGDATAPVLNTWTTGTIAKTADLVMTFSEKIIPVAGQVVKVYENGTNTLVATINVNGLNADKDNVLTIPNSAFNTFLSYGKTYYAQFNAGLVTDECGNPTTSTFTNKTDWTFTIEADPAPKFVCNAFAPTGTPDKQDLTPSFVIKFSEPVVPVMGKVIDIYESLPNNATANLGNFNVTSMVASADKMQYTITYSAITALKPQLTYGNCYHMNIQAGAFKEAAGVQTTAEVVSFVTTNAPVLTECKWDFCIQDIIAPKVTFWPANEKENIPLNAYLFAYISEPVQFQEGFAFTEVNAMNSFKLEKLASKTAVSGELVPFKVEAVGTNFDKQRVMITPLDPAAPDFGATTNPTMDDDTWYRLSVINPNTGGYHLEDAAGNDLLAGSVVFHTEDITCPTNVPVVTSAITGSGFTFEVQLDEKGTVDYRVVKKGAANTAENAKASGSAVTNASGYVKFVVNGIDANTASGYDYDLYIVKTDDETDRLDTDAEIMAEWPYTMNPSWNLETIRIKDLRPAPNKCEAILAKTVTLCDNDAPFITAYSPSLATPKTDFVVTDNITFTLNEPVQFTAGQPAITPNQIALRDFENNLVVESAITLAVVEGKYVVTIDPTNPLADQHRYYVTWDRYAINDLGFTCAGPNYLAERTDKSWWFKTKDNTAPVVLCESLLPVENCVDKDADLVVTVKDGNLVDVNPAISFIEIYEVNDAVPHERIPVASATRKDNGNGTYTFTFPTAYFYLSDKCYTAVLPAGLFKDQAGNTSVKPACQWNFCAKDYEAPIASWGVNQDFSYMYVATTDQQYDRVLKTGDAGETLEDVPTSSYIVAKFNENIMVLDTIGKDTWRNLPVSELTTAEIGNALSVSNGTKALVYGKDFRVEKLLAQNRFAIVITDDFSHLGYSGSNMNYIMGSMASNATYHVGLKKGFISDPMDAECESHNIIEEDVNLLTIITRDDTPPTLVMKDANGALLCGASCADANNSYLANALQPNEFGWLNFSPVWPVQGKDSLCNICVAPGDHITLEFSKPVVKTPTDLINVNPFWWENGGVDWWTTANLGLKPEDFINPATSKYIKFQKRVGKTWVSVDALDHVTVTNNQTIQLFWKGNLESEGIYAITFAPYTVKDQIRVPDGNEFLGQTCVFQVKDHQKPLVAKFEVSQNLNSCNAGNSKYPVDVNTDAQLSILFNEGVQPGLAGKKLIIRRENGQQQQIIDASTITVDPKNGKRILVNNADFEENTLYYVEIQAGFVTDTAVCGINEYAGIDPEDSAPGWQAQIPNFAWVFKTGDNTPPEPIVLTPNRQSDVSRQSDLTMIFDENVYTSCICTSEPSLLSSPMTWEGTSPGKGFYIYADNGIKPSADFGNFVEFIPWDSPRIIISGSDIYNGKTSDKVIINPATEFEKNMVYYIRVSKGIFCDGYKNTWDGIGDSTTWKFTITNDVAPEISTTTPNFKALVPETLAAENNGYVVADLSMSFVDSEQKKPLMVKAGVGSVKIFEYIYNPVTLSYEEKLWKEISINDPSVEFVGNTVTIKDVKLRDDVNPESCNGPRMYYVTVNSGAITNGYPGSLTFWEGFNDAFDWRFYTGADNTFVMPAEIVSPVDTNMSVEDASKLEIKFAENIEAIPGTNAKVKIFNANGDALVDQFTVVAANIFGGNTLKLTTDKLVDETKYYVLIENGAFGDTSSCSTPFPGIMDKEEWTFATGDNTAPVPVWAADLDNCEDTCVTLTFNFDETNGVTAAAGKVNLLVDGKVFASAPAEVGDNVNEITAKFCNLPDTTVFTISLDAAVVIDNGNNKMANVEVADPAWTFATGDNTNPSIISLEPVIANAESSVTLTVLASEVVTPVAGKKIIISSVSPAKSFEVTDMVTEDGGISYTLVVDGLADMTNYDITLEAGAFQDMACQANVSNEYTWSFTTDDNTAPQIVTTTPEDGDILPSYVGMDLAFSFDEKVTKGTGNITVTRGTSVLDIPVSSSTVVVDGENVSIDLDDMLYFGKVTVSVPQGAFVDLANQPNSSVAKSWTFTIFDETAPNCVTIVNPTDGQTGLGTEFALEMSFCERMVAGNQTKKLKVYEVLEVQGELGGNKLFYSTPITAEMISGKLVSVPLTGLSDNTSYTVMIDADAIRDEAGNAFEGITDPIQWNFTTGDNTAPTVVSVTPASSSNAKNSFDVTIKFSEDVTGVASAITVSTGEVEVSGSGDTYVATITGNDGDVITMTIGTTVVDASMNNLATAVTKTYTIGDNAAPTVVVTDPVTPVSTVFTVGLTFNEPVSGVADAITVTGGRLDDITGSGKDYVLTIFAKEQTSVTIVLGNTIKDTAPNANVFAGLTLTYKTGDFTAPVLVTNTPTLDNKLTDTHPTFKLTFNEDVKLGAGGNLKVYKLGTTTAILDIPVTAAMINGKEVTVNYATVTPGLDRSTRYYVKVDGSALTDAAGNAFVGVNDATAWIFLTGANWPTPNIDQLSLEFKVYPNPFVDFVMVDNASQLSKVVVSNIAGQIVKEVVNPTDKIQLNELRSGVYFISLYDMDNVIAKTAKIVKR